MYRNSYQRGMLTVFFSVGSKPLNIWETHTKDGYITRFLDQDIKSMVLEIGGTNVSTTYMTCPKGNTVLGITMPFLVMIVKNLKKYFTFEVTILDETGTRRRFRVSNFQSTTQILPLCTVMPIGLSDGWNQIQFNLAEFTRRAYQKQFVEVQKLKINANIRLRRIYFTERLMPEDQLPPEYKLYFPLATKGAKGKKTSATDIKDKENLQITPVTESIVEKKDAVEKSEEVKRPSTVIVKEGSKASVKKVPSIQGSKADVGVVPEKEVIPGSKQPSVAGSKQPSVEKVSKEPEEVPIDGDELVAPMSDMAPEETEDVDNAPLIETPGEETTEQNADLPIIEEVTVAVEHEPPTPNE
jgi:hypothetical protein